MGTEIFSNCYGYVLFKLGLRTYDWFQDPPSKHSLLSQFEEVDGQTHAEAIAVVSHRDNCVWHIVAVENEARDQVSHRRGAGAPIRSSSIEKALYPYRDKDLQRLRLRVRKS